MNLNDAMAVLIRWWTNYPGCEILEVPGCGMNFEYLWFVIAVLQGKLTTLIFDNYFQAKYSQMPTSATNSHKFAKKTVFLTLRFRIQICYQILRNGSNFSKFGKLSKVILTTTFSWIRYNVSVNRAVFYSD